MFDFVPSVIMSVFAEQAEKAAAKQRTVAAKADALEPPKPPAQPPAQDPFLALEAHLKTIDQAHAQTEADARRAYLDLLARMAPARTGPTPPAGAHALAADRTEGPPPPAEVLAVLRGVNKSPDGLRRDVKLLATLRDLADHAARFPELFDAEQQVDDELHQLQAAFAEVELEWEAKLEVKRRQLALAARERQAAERAVGDLQKHQGIDDALRRLSFPWIADRSKATTEQLEQERVARAAEAELQEISLTLGALEDAFFPPPPEPEPRRGAQDGVVYYTPRREGP